MKAQLNKLLIITFLALTGVSVQASVLCSAEVNVNSDLTELFGDHKPELLAGLINKLNVFESTIDKSIGKETESFCLILNMQDIAGEIFGYIAASDIKSYEFVINKINERYEYFLEKHSIGLIKNTAKSRIETNLLMHKYDAYFDLLNLSYQTWVSLYLDKIINDRGSNMAMPLLAISTLRLLNASNASGGSLFTKFTKKGSSKLLRLQRYFMRRRLLAVTTNQTPRLAVAKGYEEQINDDVARKGAFNKGNEYPKSPLKILARSLHKNKQWKDEPVHQTYNFYKEYLGQQIVVESMAVSAGMAAGAVTATLKAKVLKKATKLFGKYAPKNLYVQIASGALGMVATYKASKAAKEYLQDYFANKTEKEIDLDFELRTNDILKYNKDKKLVKLHNGIQSFQSYIIQYGNFKLLPLISDRYAIYRKISIKVDLDLFCTSSDKKLFLNRDETMPSRILVDFIDQAMADTSFTSIIEENSLGVIAAIKKVDKIMEIIKGLDTPLKESYLVSFENYKKELKIQLDEGQNFALVKHDLEVNAVERLVYDMHESKLKPSQVCGIHSRFHTKNK